MVCHEKLYHRLDAMVAEYQRGVIRELEREGWSSFLAKKLRDEEIGAARRIDNVRGKSGPFEETNALLGLEKDILLLCRKLNEPIPTAIQVMREYVVAYIELRRSLPKWHYHVPEADLRHLKRELLARLEREK